jgi:hypothetical protein
LRRILSDTLDGSESARDTVIGDTPAWRAMSLIVISPPPLRFVLPAIPLLYIAW